MQTVVDLQHVFQCECCCGLPKHVARPSQLVLYADASNKDSKDGNADSSNYVTQNAQAISTNTAQCTFVNVKTGDIKVVLVDMPWYGLLGQPGCGRCRSWTWLSEIGLRDHVSIGPSCIRILLSLFWLASVQVYQYVYRILALKVTKSLVGSNSYCKSLLKFAPRALLTTASYVSLHKPCSRICFEVSCFELNNHNLSRASWCPWLSCHVSSQSI